MRLKSVLLFLSSVTSLVVSSAAYSATLPQTAPAQISPEILNELKDFANLIPSHIVDEVVAEHYLTDGDFRKALKFLRSKQFSNMLQQLQLIPEVIEILDFLHLNANSIEQRHRALFDLVHALFASTPDSGGELPPIDNNNIVLLDGNNAAAPTYAYELCTFSTFVSELMEHLPRAAYVQMINEKRQKSAAFAEFYTALRSPQLRPMVDAAMKAQNLAEVVKTLSANKIDVKSLEPIGFEVISWGPAA